MSLCFFCFHNSSLYVLILVDPVIYIYMYIYIYYIYTCICNTTSNTWLPTFKILFLCLYKESGFTLYGVLLHLHCYFKSDLMNKIFFIVKVLRTLYEENLLRKKVLIVVRKANVFVRDQMKIFSVILRILDAE